VVKNDKIPIQDDAYQWTNMDETLVVASYRVSDMSARMRLSW